MERQYIAVSNKFILHNLLEDLWYNEMVEYSGCNL